MRALISLAALVVIACGGQPSSAPAHSGASNTGRTDATRWTASAQYAGPVRIGMTAADAEMVLAARFVPSTPGACVFRKSPAAPDGVLFMEAGGRIARVDITQPGVPTDRGVEVGATESRVREAYGAQVSTSPHKYTDGEYLTIATAPDHRIVFETDGEVVTRYRVGRLPEVEWVEGCS